MKVLKLIHTQGHGGAENTFRWLAWGLRRQGIDVVAAIPRHMELRKENWIQPALEELEIPYVTFDKSGSPWRMFDSITRIIGQVRPDMVHSHLLDSSFYAALACGKMSLPHLCTEHGDVLMDSSPRTRLKYAAISRLSRYVVCVSEAVRGGAAHHIRRSKLRTIYNGIRFMAPGPSTFREEWGISPSAICIGSVGNLYPVKGHTFLLTAFAAIASRNPATHLVLVGRGAEEKRLREQVKNLGIPEGRVIFTGFRRDVGNILNALDLYVQPSLSEGHPLAVLEAMSLGLPVIASRAGGLPELLGHDTYGTLAAPGSSEDLTVKIAAYLSEPELFREKAELGKNFVTERYSVEGMARSYIDCYCKIMSGT